METHVTLEGFDIIRPETFEKQGYPHEAWTLLRREDPVHWFDRTEGEPFWAVTKYEDIVYVGRNPELFVSGPRLVIPARPLPPQPFEPPKTLIQLDPPKHGKYRKLIMKRFTPGALKKIHGDIERIAKKIVDDLLEEGDEGECDFVEKISAPLPIAVIAWLLGVPEADWRKLFDWTNRLIGAEDPEFQTSASPDDTAQQALGELFEYFTHLVEEKKRHPADDLVTLFAHAEVDGEPLPWLDVLAWCLIIVVAGNETTRNATTGGMLALIEHQDELRKIQRDPSLLKTAVEEILRWTSPIIHFARTATRDTELRGRKIRAGDRLALFYPSANRDEEMFEDPFLFRVDRYPNPHLAFGVGEHYCAGAHVARLELEFAYKYFLPRIEEIELAGEPVRLRSNLVGGLKHLPIRYKLKPA
ncbi:MAG: cytochrome P450 [Candidatus Binatia bacterium]|nr:MAG: cytochrome P450 [Candidatus Binatia bacterium]